MLADILSRNRDWSASRQAQKPDYFTRLAALQAPYLPVSAVGSFAKVDFCGPRPVRLFFSGSAGHSIRLKFFG